jgi:RHS repeat-associated protein
MMTLSRMRLRAALSGGLLAWAMASLPGTDALACPAGGGTCSSGKKDPASLSPTGSLNVGAGNPINVMSGNKYLREEDMPALPGVLGLEIVRHYNTVHSGAGAVPGSVGRGWKLSYETQLLVASGGMQVIQADGAVTNFSRDILRPAIATSNNPANGVIHVKRQRSGTEYLWRWIDGRELTFDHRGKLLQVKAATGEILSLMYDAQGLLVKVTDPQGRSMRLAYPDRQTARRGDSFRGVQAIDSPVGRFVYQHGSVVPKGAVMDRWNLLANLVRVRHPNDSQVREYHYEDARHPTFLTGITIAGQRFATYGYNADGKGVLSTHAGDADKVTLDYARPGLTIVTNSVGQKTSYRYSLQNDDYQLGEVRGPGCAWCGPGDRRYGYNGAGQLVDVTGLDGQGVPLQTARTDVDHLGRPVRVTRVVYDAGKAMGAHVVARYEYADRRTSQPTLVARPSVVPGREAVQRISYNAAGQPVRITEQGWAPAVAAQPASALERTTLYRYRLVNGRSLLAEIDGPLPNGKAGTPADSDITRFDYDPGGSYPTRIVAPGNLVTEVRKRDAALRPLVTVSTDGVRLSSVEEELTPSGQVSKRIESAWLLDAKGQVDTSTRQVNTLSYQYDAQGRLQGEARPGLNMTRYRYDGAGNLTEQIAADGSRLVRAYDTERQLVAETRYGPGAGAGVMQRYGAAPANGAGAAELDWRNGRVDEQWPDASQPLKATYQLGQPDSAAAGLVEDVTRPDGSRVRRWFDDFGRIAATSSPEHGLQLARHDNAGNLVALRNGASMSTTIVRDAQGRALEVRYADAMGIVQERLTMRYAGIALAEEVRYEQGVADSRILWRSDAWGRTSGKELTILGTGGKPLATLAAASEIDRDRQTVRKTLPSGAELGYHYDAAGKVTGIELDGKPLLSDIRHAMTLDGLRPVAFGYANGRRSETRYNPDGTLASHLTGTDLITATYDAPGRSARLQRTPASAVAMTQQASGWRALLDAWLPNAHAADVSPVLDTAEAVVSYDAHGRLVSEVRDGRTALTAGYDRLGNRAGTPAVSIDSTGNVLESGDLRLAYNAAGELRRVTGPGGAELATYRYDARGHRIAKKAGAQVRYFMYDDGQLLAEADAAGQIVAEYVYLGRRPVARLRYGGGKNRWLTGDRAELVIEYLHTDQRNAVDTVTDADGKLLWRGDLDAFGVLRSESGRKGSIPLRLSGQYADTETGLYYNVHRYYDPAVGRYLQADPLGLAAGLNMYAYAENDPLQNTDPLGLKVENDDGWAGIIQPWLFGTLVHSRMANQVRGFTAPGWGANDGRSGTWDKLRPDAYYVDPSNVNANDPKKYSGTLWELKPISWQEGSNYIAGKDEVDLYIKKAKTGCWTAGSSKELVDDLKPTQVFMGNATYDVKFVADKVDDNSGLLFYTKKKQETKQQPQTVPAPVLSKKDADELAKQIQAMRDQGKKEGWTVWQEIGMVVLVGLAIAAAIAVAILAAPTIGAIIASLGAAIAAAAAAFAAAAAAGIAATASMAGVLAALFAFTPTQVAAAEQKGKEKEQGMLDGAIDWFKSWF